MPKYYPVLMNLESRPILVVGGGEIAARKAAVFCEYGARVIVVARKAGVEISKLAADRRIELHERPFEESDLDVPILVVAATNDTALHRRIKGECDRRRLPCNVVDVPELCGFIVPSIIRRGELMVTISTDGLCPAYAKYQRQRLERCCFPEGSEAMLHVITAARNELKRGLGKGMTDEEKFEILRGIAESNISEILARDGEETARTIAIERVHKLAAPLK